MSYSPPTTSFPFLSQIRIIYQPQLYKISSNRSASRQPGAYTSRLVYSYGASFAYRFPRNKAPMLPAECGAATDQGFQSGEDDPRVLETVLKLYTAIKNKNFNELSDIIGEECLCICNFISAFQPFSGREIHCFSQWLMITKSVVHLVFLIGLAKLCVSMIKSDILGMRLQQVLAFFSSLMKNLGNKIEFFVQPTFQDGMSVGVSWKLEWTTTRIPIGQGFSFYTCHVYQGKVTIKNIEMFLEPLLHIEPLRMKMISSLSSAVDEFGSRQFKFEAKLAEKILFAFLLVVALLFFCRKLSRSTF